MDNRLITVLIALLLVIFIPITFAFADDGGDDPQIPTPETVVLTIDMNGADGADELLVTEYEPGSVVELELKNPERLGYAFLGWLLSGGDGVVLHRGESITIDEDITLTAIWERDDRTITEKHFPSLYTYDGRFTDAVPGDWYFSNVERSFELGLINGVSETSYNPGGTISTLQAVVLAARLHSLYYNGTEEFPAGEHWYSGAVEYAVENQIVSHGIWSHLDDAITRAKFFETLTAELPDELLYSINELPKGQLDPWTGLPQGLFSDLDAGSIYAKTIYRLYQAGVLTGDSRGIRTNDTISRAEAAALITRIADETLRIKA